MYAQLRNGRFGDGVGPLASRHVEVAARVRDGTRPPSAEGAPLLESPLVRALTTERDCLREVLEISESDLEEDDGAHVALADAWWSRDDGTSGGDTWPCAVFLMTRSARVGVRRSPRRSTIGSPRPSLATRPLRRPAPARPVATPSF